EPGGCRCHDPHLTSPAEVCNQIGFERGYLGAAGQLPQPKHIGNRGNALLIDRRPRKRQKRLHTELRETRTTPVQMSAIPSILPGVKLSPSQATDTAATTT